MQKQRDKVDSLNQQVKTLLAEGCPGPGADNPDAEDVDGVPWKVKYERERTQVLNLEAECNGYKKELQLRIGRVNSLEEKVQTLSEDKNELTIRWKRGERDLRDYKEVRIFFMADVWAAGGSSTYRAGEVVNDDFSSEKIFTQTLKI